MTFNRTREVTGFVRADGQVLRNGAGKEIVLRGVGFGSWLLPEGYMWKFPKEGDRPRRIEGMIEGLVGKEKAEQFWSSYYYQYIAEEDIARIADEGFNSVRLPVNSRFLLADASAETTNGLASYREDRLVLLDRMIDWCRMYGLYVILDLHGAPGGQTGANIDDSEFDRPDLFIEERHWRQTVDMWRMLASRYRDDWIIAGYDLLNEPLPEWFSSYNDKVMPLYRDIVQAIREVDQRHMIILEGVHWSTDWSIFEDAFGDNPIDDNVLLQFHKYWNNPDTESIAQYLELRDKWNVPIFMGEGGENNKDWYTGAFQLFEDHRISWNFWTWKKLDTTNSPCSIRRPEGWERLVDYLQGGEKPNAETAERILWDYLDRMKLANCDYLPEVVRALLRRAPVRIPAVFYGYKGEGVSYELASGSARALDDAFSTDFRAGDRTKIRFVDSGRTVATFAHGGGEEWEPDHWLCLELAEGDWFSYAFIGDRNDPGAELTLQLKLRAVSEYGELALTLDGQPASHLRVAEDDWHASDKVALGAISPGVHHLSLRCSGGPIQVKWLLLEKKGQ
ncbi:glycoside hydrolase family 5 protein [Paenibacillus sp. 1011MAR3C5]|uniref:glycoside hydrolase family 5 protein n=1 Tax=Paenibacillus sp. 1011MAR3C5 TaxID=1675787 RepID=UPI000E6D05AB|nr:cellulase family glycosylhydrolase [Paenibacillus sp. 1011MAR3C5]RJE88790.1 glycoside hydrolase family 5 protein [Paenibacillus sp. 1011MAR3C5]